MSNLHRQEEIDMGWLAIAILIVIAIFCSVTMAFSQTSYATYTNDILNTKHTYNNSYSAKVKFVDVETVSYSKPYGGRKIVSYAGSAEHINCTNILQAEKPLNIIPGTPKVLNSFTNTYVEKYNLDHELIESYSAISRCEWVYDDSDNKMTFTEYKPNGKISKTTTQEVWEVWGDDTAVSYSVQGTNGTYIMVFWKDRSVVAYEFVDGYTLMVNGR